MGRWDKEFSKAFKEGGSSGYPKRKGRLGVKLLLMGVGTIFIVLLSALLSIAFKWDSAVAALVAIPVVVVPFVWIYVQFLERKI